MTKRYFLEAATLIVAAVLCATIANALAGRERKVALVASYPNALKVPGEPATAPVEPLAAPTTTTTPDATQPTAQATTPAVTTTTAPPTTTAPTSTQPLSNSATQTQARNPATPQPNPATSQPAATLAPPPPTPHHPPPQFNPHPDKPYIELGYSAVAALHAAGALFLDARRTSVFEQGHIAGARPVSVWESDVDEKVRKIWNERNSEAEQAKPIVVYCAGGECEDSHNLAQKLFDAQFTNVYVYRDGFPDWQKHGGAIHSGGQP
jgi:rhodanese-related sulfurtransferase